MVELGMFVESIAEELAMDRAGAPSLERRNTVGHKSLLAGGLKSLGFKSTEPQASGSVKSEPHEPKCDGPAFLLPPAPCCPPQEIGVARARRGVRPLLPPLLLLRPFTLRFPLREADVLELVASFCRGQQLSSGSVEQLLDLHLGVLQPLPNAGGKLQTLRPALSRGRRGPPWAASGEPEGPDVLPGTQLSPRRSSWRQLAAGTACMGGMGGLGGLGGQCRRVAACVSQADQPSTPVAQVVRFDVPAGQELCIVGDLHGQFEVRISGLLPTTHPPTTTHYCASPSPVRIAISGPLLTY